VTGTDEEPTPPELEFLTEHEKRTIAALGDMAGMVARCVADGPNHDNDLAELVAPIHVVQNTLLAQAAARAYPDKYRLLGETLKND
jgi:hypothetical protein